MDWSQETFFSTIAGFYTQASVVLMHIISFLNDVFIKNFFVTALLILIAIGLTISAADPDRFASGTVVVIKTVFSLGTTLFNGWNSIALVLPDIYTVTNAIILAVGEFFKQFVFFMCPVFPPQDLQRDCPNLASVLSVVQTLWDVLQTLFVLVQAAAKVLFELIKKAVVGNTGQSFTWVDFLKAILNFVVYIFSDLIPVTIAAFTGLFTEVAEELSTQGITTLQAIVKLVFESIRIIIKGAIRLFMNAFLSVPDKVLCTLNPFAGLIPCTIKPGCIQLFKPIWIPLPNSDINIYVDLGKVCDIFYGTCPCYRCINPFGDKVPCQLNAPGSLRPKCVCIIGESFFPLLTFILSIVGLEPGQFQ